MLFRCSAGLRMPCSDGRFTRSSIRPHDWAFDTLMIRAEPSAQLPNTFHYQKSQ